MKLTRRKLIQSLSAVLAAFAALGRRSPTVGLAPLEMKPRSLGVTTLVSMRERWVVDKDGKWWLMQEIGDTRCFRAVPTYWHGEPPFVKCDPTALPLSWEPRSKYFDWAEAAKPFDQIASNIQDVKRIEFEKP